MMIIIITTPIPQPIRIKNFLSFFFSTISGVDGVSAGFTWFAKDDKTSLTRSVTESSTASLITLSMCSLWEMSPAPFITELFTLNIYK